MNNYSTDIDSTGNVIVNSFTNAMNRFASYIPQFLAGLVILIVGLIVASLLKAVVLRVLQYLQIEKWFNKAGMDQVVKFGNWPAIIGEIVKWAVIIVFLIPTAEAWGLPQVTAVLQQLLLYIPNVFVAVIIGFVGLAVSNLVRDLVTTALSGIAGQGARLMGQVARIAIIFFTSLVVLNQLGIASDLIRILFTGIVAMLAIAGGLAFGLGGQDEARNLLAQFRNSMRNLPKPQPQQPMRRPQVRR